MSHKVGRLHPYMTGEQYYIKNTGGTISNLELIIGNCKGKFKTHYIYFFKYFILTKLSNGKTSVSIIYCKLSNLANFLSKSFSLIESNLNLLKSAALVLDFD